MFCFGWTFCSLWTGPMCFKAPGGSCAWPKAVHGLHTSPPQPLTVETLPVLPSFSPTASSSQFTSYLSLPISCSALLASVSGLSQDLLASNTTFEVLVVILDELHIGKV